jgi:hypothetical protein
VKYSVGCRVAEATPKTAYRTSGAINAANISRRGSVPSSAKIRPSRNTAMNALAKIPK